MIIFLMLIQSLPTYSLGEEIVGIKTMEDVMEELLQEEILDETDEYVDVHNKNCINLTATMTNSNISTFSFLYYYYTKPTCFSTHSNSWSNIKHFNFWWMVTKIHLLTY